MKFSIIMPTFNSVKYVGQSIKSVLNNNDSVDMELLVLDDGSTDNTVSYIKNNFSDPRIRLYSLIHRGPANIKNFGLDIARGDYVIFVDSDDLISQSYFKVINGAIKKGNPDLIIFRYGYFTNNIEKIKFDNFNGDRIDSMGTMVWNKIYSAKLIENIRFPANTVYEDVLFSAEARIKAAKVNNLDKILYFYRQRDGSITRSADTIPNQHLDVLKDFIYFFEKLDTDGILLTSEEEKEISILFNTLMLDHIKSILSLNSTDAEKKFVIRKFTKFKRNYMKKKLKIDVFGFNVSRDFIRRNEYLLIELGAYSVLTRLLLIKAKVHR